jgi:hypothetical protein
MLLAFNDDIHGYLQGALHAISTSLFSVRWYVWIISRFSIRFGLLLLLLLLFYWLLQPTCGF